MRSRFALFSTIALAILAFGCESMPGRATRAPQPPAPPSPPAPTMDPSALRGRLAPESEAPRSGSPILVYLDPVATKASQPESIPPKTVALRRRDETLEPSFVLASTGQVVVFSNQDDVYHAIFSYSEPNAFELGTLGLGETKSIHFAAPGLVRFYCSLHESEHGLIFVAPSQYLAMVDGRGEYSMVGVPPGRYRLRTWSDTYANFDREITLRSGESAWREIQLEAADGE